MFCSLWPLLEHLLHGFICHLLVLIAVVAQSILTYPAPDQRLLLRVIKADDQCSLDILLGADSPHAVASPAYPGTIGGLLSEPLRSRAGPGRDW